MNQTILVDWRLYRQNPYTQDFVTAREGQARMVLLVSDPLSHDYDHEEANAHTGDLESVPYIEWDAVIRNTGGLEDVDFKKKALNILQDASDLVPVIGLDIDYRVNKMYRGQGVLITTEDI
jgi:hypothetical protein